MATTAEAVRERIGQTNDLGELLRIYRGFYNRDLREFATDVNALAGDKISQMTGLGRDGLSTMGDQQIVQAYQGMLEKKQLEEQATTQQGQINKFADEFEGRAKTYREQLAEALAQNNKKAFEMENPWILEDLNARGLFRSETAVNSAQAEAMKELELDRSNKLLAFDTSAFNDVNDLRSGGLSALLGGNADALNAAFEGRRTGLEMDYNKMIADQEQSLAQSLARKKRRSELYNSLINAGSRIAQGAASAGMGAM
jgi:hypothetical protein